MAQYLTLDHVFPKSRGGKTSWENIVTCCMTCNNKKADYLLSEINMKPLKKPVKPDFIPKIIFKLRDEEESVFSEWLSWGKVG